MINGASLRDRASRAAHGAAARLRHPATIACAYGLIGLATFGHCAAHNDAWQKRHCETPEQRQKMVGLDCYSSPALEGFGAAIAWPFYWSWELQQ